MIESISKVIPEVTIHNNRAVTTSIAVANYFEKSHDNVLKKIRAVMLDCPQQLTVKDIRSYSPCAAAKSVAGIGVPVIHQRTTALAVFLCAKHVHIQIMVDCVGASSEAPDDGPVRQLRTVHHLMVGVVGGEFKNFHQRASL